MSGDSTFHNGNMCVPVFCFNDDVGEHFFKDLGLNGNKADVPVGDRIAQLELVQVLETSSDDVEAAISKADAAILLVKYLDRITMTRIRDVHHLIHNETLLPKVVVILRDQKESQYKISCTYCGQKLWVRDRDIGRRGNCPRCRKNFMIPEQRAYVTSMLMLTDSEPVEEATVGNGSCENTVVSLVNRIISMEDGIKSSTMKIELPPEDE